MLSQQEYIDMIQNPSLEFIVFWLVTSHPTDTINIRMSIYTNIEQFQTIIEYSWAARMNVDHVQYP